MQERCIYCEADDWVFASEHRRGRKPYWGQAILRRYLRPAARTTGIEKRIGWHTFRHSYSSLLRSLGTELKMIQELLRHSSFRSTLDVYTQAMTPAKTCGASSDLVARVLLERSRKTVPDIPESRVLRKPREGKCLQPATEAQKGANLCLFAPWFYENANNVFVPDLVLNGGDDETRTRDPCRDSAA